VTYARRAFAVLWKDVLTERRSKATLNALLFFSLLLLFVFQFTLGSDRERLTAALPGLLWLGFVLSGLVGLGRTFLLERENDCWDGLLLTPGDKSAIYLGKVAGNLVLMLIVEAIVRAREELFPVLLLPVEVPVLLGSVKATEAALAGEPLSAVAQWLQLLAAADVIYVVAGLLTFDALLEG
jgi:heme exporter protein B